MIFQEPMTSLNPLHTVEKQLSETLVLHQGLSGARASEVSLEWLGRVGLRDPEQQAEGLPPPALRRRAPAGHDRHGAGQQAAAPDRRRAHHRPGRDDPGPDPRASSRRFQKELGMAVLFITHDLGIVRRVADRVAVMHDGVILEENGVGEIFASPAHPYTKSSPGHRAHGGSAQRPICPARGRC